MIKSQEEMTNVLVPALEAITPGSGCYLNEVLPLPHLTAQKTPTDNNQQPTGRPLPAQLATNILRRQLSTSALHKGEIRPS